MTNQRHPVHLSIASSTEIEDTARRLKAAREEFLSAGNLQYPPRQMILDSWQRCRAMQVNPSLRSAPLAITREVELHRNSKRCRTQRGIYLHGTAALPG